MDVIPVIDVQHGRAVRAAGGKRNDYHPIETPLAPSSDPVAVALGLRSLFAFPILYIADLDGIEGRGSNVTLPEALTAALPGVKLWLDEGATPAAAARWLASPLPVTPVIGTESLRSAEDVAVLRAMPPESYVLSLDFKGDDFDGPQTILDDALLWPDRVIVMTLAKVGSGAGPDLQRVRELSKRAGARRIYAAGGVRDVRDVEALSHANAAGVLVASALHEQKITAGDLEMIAGR